MPHPFSWGVGRGGGRPCLQGEDILLMVMRYPFIQESRPFVCGVYLSVSGDQRKEISVRTERTPNVFSGEVDCTCARKAGRSFGWVKRTFPARSTWWVEILRRDRACSVPRILRT